ncbi:MAG: MerR family DNA-binding transcriptional regulator [Candidatus Hermodarchaeota archaeon]
MVVRVSIAAKLIGVCIKTLHRWEASGKLLPPLRTKGGHRRYETSDLMRLRGVLADSAGNWRNEGEKAITVADEIGEEEAITAVVKKNAPITNKMLAKLILNIFLLFIVSHTTFFRF